MSHRFRFAVLFAALGFSAMSPSARAGERYARDPSNAPTAGKRLPRARMYYPQDIEGGSPGNLPFNNQIRKHVDPLNANGGR